MTPKKHINNFWHPPSPGTIPQICLCLSVFCLSLKNTETNISKLKHSFPQQIWVWQSRHTHRTYSAILLMGPCYDLQAGLMGCKEGEKPSIGALEERFYPLSPQGLQPRRPGTSVETAKMPKVLQKNAQSDLVSLAENPTRVSRTLQTLFRTGGNSLKQGFAPCKRLFWDSCSGGPKTPFALSLSTFGPLFE